MAHRDPTALTGRGTDSTGRGAQHSVCVRSRARLWWGHGGGSERAHRLGLLVLLWAPARRLTLDLALAQRGHLLRARQSRGETCDHGRGATGRSGRAACWRELDFLPSLTSRVARQRRCQEVRRAAGTELGKGWVGRGGAPAAMSPRRTRGVRSLTKEAAA